MPTLIDALATTEVQVVTLLIAVDVVVGLIAAVVKKEFRFGRVAGFMHNGVIGYLLGFAVVQMIGQAIPSLGFLVPVVYILVIVAVLASVARNLNKLGLPLPGSDRI